MLKYLHILIILYSLNLVLTSFINLMVKNINLFNYKNTSAFAKNKFFFDILFTYLGYSNKFAQVGLNIAKRE